jgi:hypothetical protein
MVKSPEMELTCEYWKRRGYAAKGVQVLGDAPHGAALANSRGLKSVGHSLHRITIYENHKISNLRLTFSFQVSFPILAPEF